MTQTQDLVVLLDDEGRATGTAPRADVHTDDTPLHLAFSCYVRDGRGRLLVTRRALAKRTWPGVWTNSFCGHPRPGEDMVDALHRYAAHELGTTVRDVECVLPDFRYRAVDASGVVEHELCPVFVATLDGDLDPNPDEVAEHQWAAVGDVLDLVTTAPWAVSPWLVAQVEEIRRRDASAVLG
jgi:isopentenyl-diphosphate Delta-isomerase